SSQGSQEFNTGDVANGQIAGLYSRGYIALWLAEKLGLRVFPVNDQKKPVIKGWPQKVTTDRTQIIAWWSQANHNIAYATGLPDGVTEGRCPIVLDFDAKNNKKGLVTYQQWLDEGLLDTLRIITPTSGRHAIFSSDVELKNSVSQIAEGVDVRGHHGFAVAAGSVILDGHTRVPEI